MTPTPAVGLLAILLPLTFLLAIGLCAFCILSIALLLPVLLLTISLAPRLLLAIPTVARVLRKLLAAPCDEHPQYADRAGFPPDWAAGIEISCSS